MIDLISRRAAIDALAEAMPSLTTPDGCGQFDHDIQVTDEAYVDCMRIIHDLPYTKSEQWIPCNKRLPEKNDYYLVTIKYDEGDYGIDIAEYDTYYKKWNDDELFGWVTAWMPLPKPLGEDRYERSD